MNLKFNFLKGIISILIPLVFWMSIFYFGRRGLLPSDMPNFIANFLNIHNLSNIFSIGNIFLFVIEVAIVYLIYGLFEKKE